MASRSEMPSGGGVRFSVVGSDVDAERSDSVSEDKRARTSIASVTS